MKNLPTFEEFSITEGTFFDNKKFNSINDIFEFKPSFNDDIAKSLMNIVMDEHKISEKAFKQLDETKEIIEKIYKDNETDINELINKSKSENKRKNYIAEEVFHKFYKNINF